LKSLTALYLDNNEFTATVPAEIWPGLNQSLQHICLTSNYFVQGDICQDV